MANTSPARGSNRRRLTTPVVITWLSSSEVTLVVGTNTRLRPGTSTTRPMTRGVVGVAAYPVGVAAYPVGMATTMSFTRPTWSPRGSNTGSPASWARKTRLGRLTA